MGIEDLTSKLETWILNAYAQKEKSAPIGFSWMYRNAPMAVAEILTGVTPEQSALARVVGTISNFITGPIWEAGREFGQKKTIGKNASKEKVKWFDRMYSPTMASLDVGANMLLYHYGYGTKELISLPTVVPPITGWLLSAHGDSMGAFADTWMDAYGTKKTNSRSWFAPNTTEKEKMQTICAVNLASITALYMYVQPHLDYVIEKIF